MNWHRRSFLKTAAAVAACYALPARSENRAPVFVYFGSYTAAPNRGEGIYVYRMDPVSGALEYVNTVAAGDNPSYLAVDPAGRYLYAVNEVDNFEGAPSGAVSSFSIDFSSGDLTLLNRRVTQGKNPVHLSVDPTGRFVLVANSAGSVALFPIQSDGSLGDASDVVRQDASEPRQVVTDPTGAFAIVNDVGLDKTSVYRIDGVNGKLILNSEALAEPGSGPRHLAYHPLGRWVYRINQGNNTMTALEWLPASGEFRTIHSLSTIPGEGADPNDTSEVFVAPYGVHVFAANRKKNTISLINMDAGTGEMTFIASVPALGEASASFGIDPEGNFLLVANQNSDSVVPFKMDHISGELTAAGAALPVGTPANVTFVTSKPGVETKPGVNLNIFTNPLYIIDGTSNARASLSWSAPAAKEVEFHLNAPDGVLLGRFANAGGLTTDKWVNDGMVFFLQDVSDGNPLTSANTLGTVRVTVRTQI